MRKSEKTRQFIIEKAAPIFNRKGIAGTAISDIMDATKLAKGGVYGNFENKDEICLEAFNYLSGNLSDKITVAIQGKSTAKEKLFAMLDFYIEIVLDKNQCGCPILNFGAEADDTHPVIKQKVNEAIIATQARIAKIVTQGIASGEFHKSFNAIPFAVKMFAMIEGGILISRIQNNNTQMKLIVDVLKTEIKQYTQ